MEPCHLEKILRNSYVAARNHRGKIAAIHPNNKRRRNAALSKIWVAELSEHLTKHQETHHSPSDLSEVRGFCLSNRDNRTEFGLNELLHDVCIAAIREVHAPVHDKQLFAVVKVLWQVESEFSSNGRDSVKDFSKLVAGSAQNKLFITPYKSDSKTASNRTVALRNTLAKVLELADFPPDDGWYLGQVPHPDEWERFEEYKVSCWKFCPDMNMWKK